MSATEEHTPSRKVDGSLYSHCLERYDYLKNCLKMTVGVA